MLLSASLPASVASETGLPLPAASPRSIGTGTTVGFADWRFPTLRQTLLYTSATSGWHSDERTVGYRYLGVVALQDSRADGTDMKFAIVDWPDRGTLEYCTGYSACYDIGLGIRPDSGRMYILKSEPSSVSHIPVHVVDYPAQRVELSAADSGDGLRVHQEVLIEFPSGPSHCDDFPDKDANRFTCMLLEEEVLSERPTTTQTLRDGLPGLVQPAANYSLIFAEEFNGSPESGECTQGMTTLDSAIWNYDANPCNNSDSRHDLCENVMDGYFTMGIASGNCSAGISTYGRFAYKYGYIEIQYSVLMAFAAQYTNFQFGVGHHRVPLHIKFNEYEDINSLDSYEKVSRTIGTVINVFEYLPQWQHDIAHQWINHVPFTTEGNTQARRSNKDLYIKQPLLPTDTLYYCPNTGCELLDWVTITKGLEWTPRGYRTHIKVDDLHDDFIVIPKSDISVVDLPSHESSPNRDQFFEYLDPDDSDSLLERVGISHVPLDLSLSVWGYPQQAQMAGRMRVEHIRIFQPNNLYLDMEPVYQ